MLRGILFVIVLTLLFGGGIKVLGLLTSEEKRKFFRGTLFWLAMLVVAIVTSFIFTVGF